MSRISVAFRAFFAALSSAEVAKRIQTALEANTFLKTDIVEKSPHQFARLEPPPPTRSEAVTLLAALQREARLVDLVKQPLSDFSDDQIGAAARNVLSDAATVLDRFFSLQPVVKGEEDSPYDVPLGYNTASYKLSGPVEGSGPFHGKLVHHGWKATSVKLPAWTGSPDSALVVAPAEVEVAPPQSSPQL